MIDKIPTQPGASKPNPILRIENLKKTYGALVAVDIERLEIQQGVITGLIGPNGAGKTTLFNVITGFEPFEEGQWYLNDTPMHHHQTLQISRGGMVRTFQVTKTLDGLTVMENVLLASQRQRGERLMRSPFPNWKYQHRDDVERAEGILERYGLENMRNHYSNTLSGGQRKLLELSRAVMAEPKLILLDEPLAGVNPTLIEKILGYMRELVTEGMTVLFVEHNIDAVVNLSDWMVCLAEGKVIAEGPPQSLIDNQVVIDAYLG